MKKTLLKSCLALAALSTLFVAGCADNGSSSNGNSFSFSDSNVILNPNSTQQVDFYLTPGQNGQVDIRQYNDANQGEGTGNTTVIGGSPFAFSGNNTQILVDPTRTHAFVVDPSNSRIRGFLLNRPAGTLSEAAGSPFTTSVGTLRSVTMHPSGQYLMAQGVNQTQVFRVNTGATLSLVTNSTIANNSPVSISISPGSFSNNGTFFHFATGAGGNIQTFAFNPTTGLLSGGTSTATGDDFTTSVRVHPNGNFVYAATQFTNQQEPAKELNAQLQGAVGGNLRAFSVNAQGVLTAANTRSLGAFFPGDLEVSRQNVIYVGSDVGSTGVRGFAINPTTGLTSELPGSPYQTNSGNAETYFVNINPATTFFFANSVTTNRTFVFRAGSDGTLGLTNFAFNSIQGPQDSISIDFRP